MGESLDSANVYIPPSLNLNEYNPLKTMRVQKTGWKITTTMVLTVGKDKLLLPELNPIRSLSILLCESGLTLMEEANSLSSSFWIA